MFKTKTDFLLDYFKHVIYGFFFYFDHFQILETEVIPKSKKLSNIGLKFELVVRKTIVTK
jgi:hypothetical protein